MSNSQTPWKKADGFFASFDDTKLFYRSWQPQADSKKALIIMHRGHEHSGRVELLVNELGFDQHWAFAYDARGHGNSPGERGFAEDFSYLVKDLDCFARYISKQYDIPIEDIAIVANSVGAVVTSAWVHDYAPPIRGMVLAAPAFRIKLYVPLALPSLRVLQMIKKKSFIKSYVRSTMLTHDKEQSEAYDTDPLIAKKIAVNILIGLHDTSSRIIDDAEAIHTPTQVLSAGSDWVVKVSSQKKFYDKLSSKDKEYHVFDGFFHGLFYEKDRHQVIDKARSFLTKCFEKKADVSFLQKADKSSFTQKEFEYLKGPAPFLKNINFKSQVLSMSTLGKLSKGIKLGFDTGFDSGKTLDYVYNNTPTGGLLIGKVIDYIYLNSIGWKGIRLRKINIEEQLKSIIAQKNQDKIKIIDIAAGGGKYLLDMANSLKGKEIHLLLRDYEQQNLDKAKEYADQLGLKNVTYQLADAFDKSTYQEKDFDIAVISGLFELFPQNSNILTALEAVNNCLKDDASLVYTDQPWHPQIEMIARTLTNREGEPWIMRRRIQAEMDELVRCSGFKKNDMVIDPYGIFTVSTAQKQKA